MTFGDDLEGCTPRLRRYARGLVAGQPAAPELADELVRATLVNGRRLGFFARWLDFEGRLYAILTTLHRDASRTGTLGDFGTIEKGQFCAGGVRMPERTAGIASPVDKLSAAVGSLALEEREALLLVVVEGVGYTRSARILRISRRVLVTRLSRARAALTRSLSARTEMRPGRPRPTHLRLVE